MHYHIYVNAIFDGRTDLTLSKVYKVSSSIASWPGLIFSSSKFLNEVHPSIFFPSKNYNTYVYSIYVSYCLTRHYDFDLDKTLYFFIAGRLVVSL